MRGRDHHQTWQCFGNWYHVIHYRKLRERSAHKKEKKREIEVMQKYEKEQRRVAR